MYPVCLTVLSGRDVVYITLGFLDWVVACSVPWLAPECVPSDWVAIQAYPGWAHVPVEG